MLRELGIAFGAAMGILFVGWFARTYCLSRKYERGAGAIGLVFVTSKAGKKYHRNSCGHLHCEKSQYVLAVNSSRLPKKILP